MKLYEEVFKEMEEIRNSSDQVQLEFAQRLSCDQRVLALKRFLLLHPEQNEHTITSMEVEVKVKVTFSVQEIKNTEHLTLGSPKEGHSPFWVEGGK